MVVDMAAALGVLYGLGPQKARDLARAFMEGRQIRGDQKAPRGTRKRAPDSKLASFRLPIALDTASIAD
jgi:hypothetical protein